MNEELTEEEKEFMKMLLSIGHTIINNSGGNFDYFGIDFDSGDLYNLSTKLGIDYYSLY